ncbi:hypothetical protein BDY17DRAFT_291948 [Neohortaea acidophila]|uniref:Uncharacterized protein n=1 Tax=Neohortaea acidophila TaxID=245834 RepID=A0A6A6Q352_9PEZI|nr:uncharacterized protein BDY17DRAFT_291948 [Neohortaea acidophila]KAF2486692.1 hypothetical protein BDY17DRAFT_291948 [Neohortaea acidophila]
MSSNGGSPAHSTPSTPNPLDVAFSSLRPRHGESSSQADSHTSTSHKRSSSSRRGEEEGPSRTASPQFDYLRTSTGSLGQRTRPSGGFLLPSAFANGSPPGPNRQGKRKAIDGQLHVDKRRHPTNRLSVDSSLRSSPLSRQVSSGVDGAADGRDGDPSSRAPSMDPAQLVQMALNLSENRKRNISNTRRVPSGTERRLTSMPMSNISTARGAFEAHNESIQLPGDSARSFDDSTNAEEISGEPPVAIPGLSVDASSMLYTFTPATLVRAEKARKYLELASEHRRLLQSLPPLISGTTSAPSRQYNPIQSLRNRRARISNKRPFPAPPDTWQDPEKVKAWIDEVESQVKDSSLDVPDESITLPLFDGEKLNARPESRELPVGPRHKRSDTAGSVITRPENSWTIEPTELLADAYWTEKDNNKAFIESRRGELVFPRRRRSVSTPKISVDLHRDRLDDYERFNDPESWETAERQPRRRKLIQPLATGLDRTRHGRLIRRASNSSTDTDRERNISGPLLANGSPVNIGPLERHMQSLIEREERGELNSPELVSADHWNSSWKHPPAQRGSVDRLRRGSSASRRDTRASLDVPRDLHRRTKSADGRVGASEYSDFDLGESPGSDAGSPRITLRTPSVGTDLIAVGDMRRSMDESRSSVPALPNFHSRNRERNKIGQADFALPDDSANNLSPIPSAGSHRAGNDASPEHLKRQGTSDSWMAMRRTDTISTLGSAITPGSSVGRFLRNRRDRIFKGKDKWDGGEHSASVTDVSEVDEPADNTTQLRRRNTELEDDESPRASLDRARPKQKFHTSNLPAFTSSARDKRIQIQTPGAGWNDSFSYDKRPKRFARVAPPQLSIPQGEGADPELVGDFEGVGRSRKPYGQLQPFGEVWRNQVAPGVYTPGISQAKRHWSIYDRLQPNQDDKITARDIARVRALLLSSGIKAREIDRRANTPSDKPSSIVLQAAVTACQPYEKVALKEEHVVAARLLTRHLNSTMPTFEMALSNFQDHTVRQLSSRLEQLRQRASDHLSNLVHDTSDDADAFIMELNTKSPQQSKRVDDAVEEMQRRRRRQFRLVHDAGFKILEWMVLGILWWIWFLVVVFNACKKVVFVIWRLLRWLLVF